MKLRLVLADDHRMLREALMEMLAREPGLEVVGEAGSAREALEKVAQLKPDVLVLDLGLPDMTGIEVARRLRGGKTAVLVLSAHADRRFVEEALKAGAAGYITKSAAAGELAGAVHAVASGGSYVSPDVAGALVRAIREPKPGTPPPSSILGRREREVLALIAGGMRSSRIAEQLHIKVGTVEVHRRNIARKLGLHTVAELTKYALREGLTLPY
jgi:two-component system NarL family response regulator